MEGSENFTELQWLNGISFHTYASKSETLGMKKDKAFGESFTMWGIPVIV